MSQINLSRIVRYPFKGFCGSDLDHASLEPGRGLPHDRRFAVTNGTENRGEWVGPRSFFINTLNDGMQKIGIDYDAVNSRVNLTNETGLKLHIDLDDPASIEAANREMSDFMAPIGVADDLPPPRIVERAANAGYWDYTDTPLSIINLGTIVRIAERINRPVDPLRFRGNLFLSGLPAWQEFGLLGKRIRIGDADLEVIRPINRCPATSVNPETGDRDFDMPGAFQEHFGHVYCGMYAKVVKAGDIKPLSQVSILGDANTPANEPQTEAAPAYPLWPRMVEATRIERNGAATRITLQPSGPWPLPDAKTGQRIRLHLDHPGFAMEELVEASTDQYVIEVGPSPTGDPVTKYLHQDFSEGAHAVISGPYGRPRS